MIQRQLNAVQLQIKQTWFSASTWACITDYILSCPAYVYFTVYLASPLLGFYIESAALASGLATLLFIIKGVIKFVLAFLFTFYFINSIKHLVYSFSFEFTKSHIARGEIVL